MAVAKIDQSSTILENALQLHVQSSIPYDSVTKVPFGISALGQLMLTAWSVDDISINHPPVPKDGQLEGKFVYINYPDSLRCTLLQISNSGYKAFSTAHYSMDQIRGYSIQITRAMADVGKLLKDNESISNQDAVNKLVNLKLKQVRTAGKKCKEESQKVVDTFEQLLALMQEVLDACTHSNTVEERNLKQAKTRKEQLEIEKIEAEEKRKKLEKDEAEHREYLKKTEDELKKAMGEVPKGLSLLGFAALEGICSLFGSKTGPLELKKLKVEVANQINLEAEKKLKRMEEENEKTRLAFIQISQELSGLSTKEISYKQAIKILKNGVTFMGQILESWRKMNEFFTPINNMIGRETVEPLDALKEELDIHQTSNFIIPLAAATNSIFDKIARISQQAYVIACVSKLYVNISGVHIMPAIGGLNVSGTANNISDEEREALKNILVTSAFGAEKAIKIAVEKEKSDMLVKLEHQKTQIQMICGSNDDELKIVS